MGLGLEDPRVEMTGLPYSPPPPKLFSLSVFLKIILFYLFLAALGLRCCAQAFSSCGEQGLLFVAVRGLLIVVASLVAEHGLSSCGSQALERRLSSCGTWA